MPECKYEPCRVMVERKPGAKGKPKIYCCREHYIMSRRKPKTTRACLFCGESFTTGRSSKLYCQSQCQQATDRGTRAASQTAEQTAAKQRRKDERTEARQRASLNCECYTECLRAFKLPCWKCDRMEYNIDAWKHEPGVLVHNE